MSRNVAAVNRVRIRERFGSICFNLNEEDKIIIFFFSSFLLDIIWNIFIFCTFARNEIGKKWKKNFFLFYFIFFFFKINGFCRHLAALIRFEAKWNWRHLLTFCPWNLHVSFFSLLDLNENEKGKQAKRLITKRMNNKKKKKEGIWGGYRSEPSCQKRTV